MSMLHYVSLETKLDIIHLQFEPILMLLELLSDAQTLPYYSAYMARILDLNRLGRKYRDS
jgi:hypothetical protein